MKLIFEGQAIVERSFDGVKFVGWYRDDDKQSQFVICRVTRDALETRCRLSGASNDDLLSAYQSVRDEVDRLASAQFSGGIERPLITRDDLVRQNGAMSA